METIINEELIMGSPLIIRTKLVVEMVNQIMAMGEHNYEDVCHNMRMTADLFEMIEEHIDKDIVKFVYSPMGTWEDESRYCSDCGKFMDEGYCIESGLEYYCSDECLHKHISEEEYNRLYDDGNGDSYWTEW